MDLFTKKTLLVISILLVVSAGAAAAGNLWGPRVQPNAAWEVFEARFPEPTSRQIQDLGFAGTKRMTRTLWQWDGRRLRAYYELTVQVEFHAFPDCIQSYGGLVDARTGELARAWRDLSPNLGAGCTADVESLWK